MSKRVGRIPDTVREQVAITYALNGNVSKTARDMNVNRLTVQKWKGQDWFVDLVDKVHQEKAEEHRATYARIVEEAQKVVLDKLPSATSAQANIIAATATDKVRLLDNMPTSISGKAVGISDLSDQFRKLAATHQLVPKSKVIEGSLSDDKDSEG